jgi:hypothetical protein
MFFDGGWRRFRPLQPGFIALGILMFQKKDGGMRVAAKNAPQSERFFDNHYKSGVDPQLVETIPQ